MADRKSDPKMFRKAVLICGSILALFFLLAFVPKIISDLLDTVPEPPDGREWEGQVMYAMFITFMAGYTIGWWRSLWGGVLIILAAMLVSIPFALDGNYGSLIFGVPQCVIGTLYVVLHWLEKRGRS